MQACRQAGRQGSRDAGRDGGKERERERARMHFFDITVECQWQWLPGSKVQSEITE